MKKSYDDEVESSTACRVRNLRMDRGLSQKQLADRLFITASQISRLESGETVSISSSLLVALAQEFQVSTDYLLGLTPVRVQKSYDISQLGLSEEVIRRLIVGTIDTDVVNRLLGHPDFPKLSALIQNYFQNTTAEGILSRNQLIDLATEPLTKLMASAPSKQAKVLQDLRFLNAQKIQANEADIEKIKNALLKILRDIKSGMASEAPTSPIATAEAVSAIRASLPDRSEVTAEDVSAAVAAYVGAVVEMDEETSEMFRKVAERVLGGQIKSEAATE